MGASFLSVRETSYKYAGRSGGRVRMMPMWWPRVVYTSMIYINIQTDTAAEIDVSTWTILALSPEIA